MCVHLAELGEQRRTKSSVSVIGPEVDFDKVKSVGSHSRCLAELEAEDTMKLYTAVCDLKVLSLSSAAYSPLHPSTETAGEEGG